MNHMIWKLVKALVITMIFINTKIFKVNLYLIINNLFYLLFIEALNLTEKDIGMTN